MGIEPTDDGFANHIFHCKLRVFGSTFRLLSESSLDAPGRTGAKFHYENSQAQRMGRSQKRENLLADSLERRERKGDRQGLWNTG